MSSATTQGYEEFPDALTTRETRLEPFDWYREMRDESPVQYDPKRGVWDVFRYADAKTILTDDETFSIDPRNASGPDDAEDPGFDVDTMIGQDPPRHDELRGIVDEAFQKQALDDLEPRVRALTTDLLDEALADDTDVIDVANELAHPLVVNVIAELLGVPADDRDRFATWSSALGTAGTAEDATASAERKEDAHRRMGQYLSELLDERRKSPQNDLLSRVAAAEADDEMRFSRQEALGMCFLMFHAGNTTTRNLITNLTWCFATHELWPELKRGDRLPSTAIEEVLRYRSPVQATTRVATADVTMQGERIEAGDRIMVWFGSANRDERQFDAAETFVPDRSPNQHMGFGHGTHYCLGAPLARLEADIVLSELLDRFETIEHGGTTLHPTQSLCSYGVESLPIRYEADT